HRPLHGQASTRLRGSFPSTDRARRNSPLFPQAPTLGRCSKNPARCRLGVPGSRWPPRQLWRGLTPCGPPRFAQLVAVTLACVRQPAVSRCCKRRQQATATGSVLDSWFPPNLSRLLTRPFFAILRGRRLVKLAPTGEL